MRKDWKLYLMGFMIGLVIGAFAMAICQDYKHPENTQIAVEACRQADLYAAAHGKRLVGVCYAY